MGVEGGDTARLVDQENFRYLTLQFDGDIMVGAQAVGMTENVGMLRGLIQTELHLGKWKDVLMENPQRVGEAYIACTRGIPAP
jgi:hypothetical protein